MTRIAQPRVIAELKGAIRKHPERYRNIPPEVEQPLGDPPEHLSAEQRAIWAEIVLYAPKGILRGADRFTLEMTCILLDQMRQNPKFFNKHPALISCLARLGLTPADRQKLGVAKVKDGNPFDQF